MRKRLRLLALLLVPVLVLAAGVTVAQVGSAVADKGGCPNDAAENGSAHANAKSAHGSDKQAARSCSAEPTPGPGTTPTPVPGDEADVRVESVSVRAPDSAAVGEEFVVRVSAGLRNFGPADSVLADTTFVFSAGSDCSISPIGSVVVEDTVLPENVGVFIARNWLVTCSQAGAVDLTAGVTVAIDPGETVIDPDPTNNDDSGSDTTQIGA